MIWANIADRQYDNSDSRYLQIMAQIVLETGEVSDV